MNTKENTQSQSEKVIAVDFDGTIAHFDDYKGPTSFGEPIAGVAKALQQMKAAGHRIIIFTTRKENEAIHQYLKEHNIPYDSINENVIDIGDVSGKVAADVYIDDRSITFNGNWKEMPEAVEKFLVWEKR